MITQNRLSRQKQDGGLNRNRKASFGLHHHLMRKDLTLSSDILPTRMESAMFPEKILLTGATGFLGSHLLHELLLSTEARIYCLVRPRKNENGMERIKKVLEGYGLWQDEFIYKISPVQGDIRREGLGFSEFWYEKLSREIDSIYHTAATVNWVFPYKGLRESNVMGTERMLRLACLNKPKAFNFISSMGVCYALTGPSLVTEKETMVSYLGEIPLAYAQTKCVSEALVRQAAERGLFVNIFRPGLISGSSRSGNSNPDDIFSRVLKACIEMKCAPDLDWVLDYCPVDFVADTVARFSMDKGSRNNTFHLLNGNSSHWRECILWLNFNGYPIHLVSYENWLQRLKKEIYSSGHALYPLRNFFFRKHDSARGITLPEFYQKKFMVKVSCEKTQQALRDKGIQCPPLNSTLLKTYLDSFVKGKFLSGNDSKASGAQKNTDHFITKELFQKYLGNYFSDPALRVQSIYSPQQKSCYSIISELVSWRFKRSVGLRKYRIEFMGGRKTTPNKLSVFVKSKAEDKKVIETAQVIASACGEKLGNLFCKYKNRLGFTRSHLRELAIYQQKDPRFKEHTPKVYGTINEPERKSWVLMLEDLEGLTLLNAVERRDQWKAEHIQAVIKGLAQLHSIWWGRKRELLSKTWLEPPLSYEERIGMKDLWLEVALHAEPFFKGGAGREMGAIHRKIIETMAEWSPPLESLPQTLIHNDFNPRNLALWELSGELKLCVYDWELASMGIPQHDLAEFLCFVLSPDSKGDVVSHWIQYHRECLEEITGSTVSSGE